MDKFQVYNRKTQSWNDENVILIPGWNENFVQDKTTDNGKVKLKYKGNTAPNWNSGDWCRFLHLVDGETKATYTHKINSIEKTNDYIARQLIAFDYNEHTKNLTVYFDKMLHPCQIIFQVWVELETGIKTTQLTIYYYGDREYDVINLSDKFSGYDIVKYLPERTEIIVIHKLLGTDIGGEIVTETTTKIIDYYVPLNHEQYILSNISMVYDKTNDEWDIQADLLEPIEIAHGIVPETRSFTNQIQKTVHDADTDTDIVYIHEAKNHLSVLESILRTTPANNDINKSWYSRIKIANADWLGNQPFNDNTFSEPSLYEILLTKYDSMLGRTPVLYFDIDGESDLPFNNARTEYVLDFLRQDGFDKKDIQLSDLVKNSSQIMLNKSWENKADGIVSNVDNLSPSSSVTYVSEYLWAVPEVDTTQRDLTNYGVDSEKGIWVLKTPHNIKNIKSIQQLQVKRQSGILEPFFERHITDISDKVYEKKQYDASNETIFNTRNAIWYEEGINVIHLNNFYYQESQGYFFRVEYEPLVSMRYDEGKDFNIIINQTDAQVGEDRFSRYLKDYLASMNKSDLIIQKSVEDWSDIVEIGSRVLDNDKTYLITNVAISNRGFDYDVIYQLNENHMRKSDNIIAPQNVRKNIEIAYSGLTDRKSCLIKDYNLSLNTQKTEEDKNTIIDKKYIFSALLKGYELKSPQLAKLRLYSIYCDEYGNRTLNVYDRLCNGARTVLNNTILFNLKYTDNAECGKQKELGKDILSQLNTSPAKQLPILYVDAFGEIKSFDCSLINAYNEELKDIEDATLNENHIKETNEYLAITTNYPLTSGTNGYTTTYIGTIKGIEYEKDMLDIFNYTIGFKVESDAQIILCNNFFKNSALFDNIEVGYMSTSEQNLQENDAIFTEGVEIINAVLNGNEITLTAKNQTTGTYKSIILWDINKKPVLIINDADKLTNEQFNGRILKFYC